jgi:hypothetical protein
VGGPLQRRRQQVARADIGRSRSGRSIRCGLIAAVFIVWSGRGVDGARSFRFVGAP